ncbi:DNA replication/repair protein RecF [Acidithiobacillus sp.]|uniref:DNA replication/repair protein RecF n=1 Tax=Acidithiobacillus sp. TaxID=1872118 RepID=UPI0025BA30DD|nr:DNA replication and repair protein RecF [Acidithiobacillus sp.]
MRIAVLEIQDVRCIRHMRLAAGPNWNWLVGPNGAGKSTVLEALHLLGLGQSWRRGPRQLIREGSAGFSLSVLRAEDLDLNDRLVLEQRGSERHMRFGGESLSSQWALLELLPIQAIHNANSEFIAGSADDRRRQLDWGIYRRHREYGEQLRQYRRLLAQRNAWLRSHGGRKDPWLDMLAKAGELLHTYRRREVQDLQQRLTGLWQQRTGSHAELSLHLQSGWREGLGLAEVLREDLGSDVETGFTRSGPHRANLLFRIDDRSAADSLSRGQLRILGNCFRLAQLQALKDSRLELPLVLIDDFAAELDPAGRLWWRQQLDALGVQVFAAGTEAAALPIRAEDCQWAIQAGQLREGKSS